MKLKLEFTVTPEQAVSIDVALAAALDARSAIAKKMLEDDTREDRLAILLTDVCEHYCLEM